MALDEEMDNQEAERRVCDVFNVIRHFNWATLRRKVPVGYNYTRPEAAGPYLAVGWRADWADQVDGNIFIEAAAWFDKDHEYPMHTRSITVERPPALLKRLFRRRSAGDR